ncbi:MAG: lytic transglycosylase domain-containing protein [Rhodosalinus sp.]
MHRAIAALVASAALATGLVAEAAAEDAGTPGGFSAKRVKPPSGGGPRITVQITPEDIARQRAAPRPPAAGPQDEGEVARALPVRPGRHAWFWDSVSPAREAAAGPARADPALALLADPPVAVEAPRLQFLQEIARARGADILRATVGTQVSPALVLAVIAVESSGRADAVSRAGAEGLMQLMPETAARFGVADSLNAGENIRGGVAYLDWLMGHFEGDPILTLAGYNAGEGAVRDHGGVPPFAETRDYVPKVLAAYSVARGLCRTPPMLITDGCVFVTGGV